MDPLTPDLEGFRALAREASPVPVSREVLADLDTPVSAFLKLARDRHAFLLESVEGGERWARYSFLGFADGRRIVAHPDRVEVLEGDAVLRTLEGGDPTRVLREEMEGHRAVELPGLPRFYGGWVGYLSYDVVRHFEGLPDANPDPLGFPVAHLVRTDRLIVFDKFRGTIRVIRNVFPGPGDDLDALWEDAVRDIDAVVEQLSTAELPPSGPVPGPGAPWTTNVTREEYHRVVERAKEYVRAGDIIQVVPSQRFTSELDVDPVDLYRALRVVNPSPYMFLLRFPEGTLIGSSPEILLRVERGEVMTRPIAGTRPRAADPAEDEALEADLRADPKELAEHVMLVDLGRNDVGRVARIGSVRVPEYGVVERYSHVMHLVSHVEGELRDDVDGLDAVAATFPAGTLTGAPKIRAMEIIDELERCRRGPYGGAVGYVGFSGDLDLCITIRTMMIREGRIHLQAGGGIVADSDPEREYQETLNKARAMKAAVALARAGFDPSAGGDRRDRSGDDDS